ncbi:hypothetical protein [Flagellimonas nanhaiensis]|uniref:Uncharacterized protein n=1 Tax=Flagellimonas nanhaiensis TaxID=2292706 RepID=A0A371JLN8_9FLAO|nr:hypothetical protein [Allomuricauda nanhaiensis]RDY57932.1 hypothetical protein DX873_17450 [Allomuricauda nanhaiensis]
MKLDFGVPITGMVLAPFYAALRETAKGGISPHKIGVSAEATPPFLFSRNRVCAGRFRAVYHLGGKRDRTAMGSLSFH